MPRISDDHFLARTSYRFIAALAMSILFGASPSVHAQETEEAPTVRTTGVQLPTTAARTLATNSASLKRAARQAFIAVDIANAREHLQALLTLYRQDRADGGSLGSAYQWSGHLAEVAHEYLRVGQLSDAMQILGEAADLNLPFDDRMDDGLGTAAAGLHRRLATLDADDRFELLHKWSMPTATRRTVRVLTSITPTTAPPAVFARALGERTRRDSFATSEIGDIGGIFSTAWELVTAADDAGTLRRLTSELSQLETRDVPNARLTLTLAKIVGARRKDDPLSNELTDRTAALNRSGSSGFATLPLEQRVWQFGYGQFDADAERTTAFQVFPHWEGSTWRGGLEHPDKDIGWTALRATGGHPGINYTVIRRWIAPANGTLTVSGNLQRDTTLGNGVRGRMISNRSGLIGQWIVRAGKVRTDIDTIDVERGDMIDFMVDSIDGDAAADSFIWTTQLNLKTNDTKQLTFDSVTGFHGPMPSTADVVIAAACLTQDWLQPIGERILKTTLEQTYSRESPLLRPFLRHAHASAIRKRYPTASPELRSGSDLELWVSGSGLESWRSARGAVRPVWFAHENHILHQTGPRNDHLFFKYPLTGDFEFSCDAQLGGKRGTDGCVAYGGLGYEVSGARQSLRVWDANFDNPTELPCPFVPLQPLPTFNRFSLTSQADEVTLSVNGHPTRTDASKRSTSPWIGLHSFAERVPIFRNFKITGNPIIPRQVKMSGGNSLRGWNASYYGERTPPLRSKAFTLSTVVTWLTTQYDWSTVGDVIHGAKQATPNDVVDQSRLYYCRPLQNGESIRYEFQYEPGRFEVHPTLGRLAFLIDPDGVRLHWMTDGDREWTGLAEDNSVVEPLNRRGPKPLPIVSGGWNKVTLKLSKDTLTLSLNEATIYTRKMEPANERTFGFYHDKNRSEVRVRNVVLSGDWPEQLTKEQLNNLAAVSNPDQSREDRRLLGAIFDDQHLHGSVLAVHRLAAKLPPQERYAFLLKWVLPSPDHDTLRLALDFTPSNPAPPVSDQDLALLSGKSRVTTGGDLISPALDLVAAAKKLGKLDELRVKVAATPADDEHQLRSRLAMLALIDMSLGDLAKAKTTLDKLASLVAAGKAYSFSERWPETLAIWTAAPSADTRDAVRDMAYRILEGKVRKGVSSGYEAWDQHMRAIASRVHYFDLLDRAPASHDPTISRLSGQSPLANWVPASRETTRTRGQGFPRSRWALSAPATVGNFASHSDDYLFYRIPLRGNFEVECDVSGFGWRDTALWVAGQWVGPVYTLKSYDIGNFRGSQRRSFDPPLNKTREWIHYRTVVRDGLCTTYFNGRKIHVRQIDAEHDPWIAIRSPYKTNGAVRNVRVTGNPEIPTEVKLSTATDLPGWLPINEGHQVRRNRKWQQFGDPAQGGGIRGMRWNDLPGSNRETLLRYHRPMVEDGTIDYEFYYREGEMHVHPALDRLAFMLQPDGVRVHWITDGRFDRTELTADNLFEERDNNRGPETVPLIPDAWNRLQLSLAGDTVDLTLNGQLIYQRELEPTNQRAFGLFHYADRTEVLARNIVWRGDWPRELPAVADQELAGEGADLDESLAQLKATFHHDFAKAGMPLEQFALIYGYFTDFQAMPSGLQATRRVGDGRDNSVIAPRLSVHGDFDIIASYEELQTNPPVGGSGGIFLQAILDSPKANECHIYRRLLRHRTTPEPIVRATYVAREPGGARSAYRFETVEAPSGRLRLARRGDTVYFLFAEGDSPNFRHFGSETTTTDDLLTSGVRLMTQSVGEGCTTTVVWKSLTVRADKLAGMALLDQQAILAELDKQRDALPERFAHDFAKDPTTEAGFHQWGALESRLSQKDGFRLVAPGAPNWRSVGISPRLGLDGDFDISVVLDSMKLARPSVKRNSAFYLQAEVANTVKSEVNLVFIAYPNGDHQAYAQFKFVDAQGVLQYKRIRVDPVEEIDTLRLARRGNLITFIYRKKGSDREQILTQSELSAGPVPDGNIRLLLHTGVEEGQSETLLKHLRVSAEEIGPVLADG